MKKTLLLLLLISYIYINFNTIKETYLYNRYARYNLNRSFESNKYTTVYFPQLDHQKWLRSYGSQ